MTFFFFVVGLEARREFDIGELRERRRAALPLARRRSAGWPCRSRSTSRSTPAARPRTAGASRCRPTRRSRSAMLALVGPRLPRPAARVHAHGGRRRRPRRAARDRDRLHRTMSRSRRCSIGRRGSFAVLLVVARARRAARARLRSRSASAIWVALLESGVDPVVVGLAMGLLDLRLPGGAHATSSARASCSGSSASSRRPSSRARRASGVESAISPNERLQQLYHPWTSYVIVPLFALANAGHRDRRRASSRARSRSPITLGILSATSSASRSASPASRWLVDAAQRAAGCGRRSAGRRSPAAARSPGIGFTVSLLIATLAFDGAQLEEAKLGVLAAALIASVADLARLPRARRCCPARLRIRALLGTARADRRPRRRRSTPSATTSAARATRRHARRVRRLRVPVLRPGRAGRARAARRLRRRPLRLAAPAAQRRAPATRSSRPRPPRRPPRRARSGRCTTCCSSTRTRLEPPDLVGYAGELGLDVDRFTDDLRRSSTRRRADRRRRRQRRPERRLRHADLLRQRPPPPRRLRHRDPLRRGARRARASGHRAGALRFAPAGPLSSERRVVMSISTDAAALPFGTA